MNAQLALRTLSAIMDWDTERAAQEFSWLSLMARLKYDTYRDYVAGARFIESLADWLQQFKPEERETAYAFVRRHLVYIGIGEMEHLVELFYPETVQPRLIGIVARGLGLASHFVWARPGAVRAYKDLLRRTLFLGLSDGARIDTFRRANVGIVGNEQVVGIAQVNRAKWDDLRDELRKDTGDPAARFEVVYLLDDFVATGTTLLRLNSNKDCWEGRLVRFWEDSREVAETHFAPTWQLHVHHYLASYQATANVAQRHKQALEALGENQWFPSVDFSYGLVLPADLPIDGSRFAAFMRLVETYYDPVIETNSMRLGGDNARLGFGACALPLVLEHNTPNNSVALLWADTEGRDGARAMRPLFRRRQRHS